MGDLCFPIARQCLSRREKARSALFSHFTSVPLMQKASFCAAASYAEMPQWKKPGVKLHLTPGICPPPPPPNRGLSASIGCIDVNDIDGTSPSFHHSILVPSRHNSVVEMRFGFVSELPVTLLFLQPRTRWSSCHSLIFFYIQRTLTPTIRLQIVV